MKRLAILAPVLAVVALLGGCPNPPQPNGPANPDASDAQSPDGVDASPAPAPTPDPTPTPTPPPAPTGDGGAPSSPFAAYCKAMDLAGCSEGKAQNCATTLQLSLLRRHNIGLHEPCLQKAKTAADFRACHIACTSAGK